MPPIRKPRSAERYSPLGNDESILHCGTFKPVLPDPENDSFADIPIDPRPPPLRLKDLECTRKLGEGVYGEVLLVRVRGRKRRKHDMDKRGTLYAVKALNKRALRYTDWGHKRDKNYERSSLARLPWNPFVCGIVDKFYDTKSLYLLLELIPNGHLFGLIRQIGPFDHATAAFYFANIVCGLDFLHTNGIVHRDLKPDNILIGPDGYLCLADFGAATNDWDKSDLTLVGTPAYMAPELIRPDQYLAPAIDWWAAGCILYEMICRKLAFQGQSEADTWGKINRLDYRWPAYVKVSKNLEGIVSGLLEPEIVERLGADGADDLREHPWLSHIDWDKMEARQYLAPYVPGQHKLTKSWHDKAFPEQSKIPCLRIAELPLELQNDDRARENVYD